jgi:hypothetical protein
MQGIGPAGINEDSAVVNKVRFHQQVSRPPLYSYIIKTHLAAGARTMLELFGFSELTDAFKRPGGVHRVWNLLSLESQTHSKFDRLNLWFESTHQVCYSETCRSHQLARVQLGYYKVSVFKR